MITPEIVYQNQISFYNGDKFKAWNSLNNNTKRDISHLKPKKRQKNINKSAYVKKCWAHTEANKHLLPNINLRKFKEYDIDHIVPISYGYKHNIAANMIGSVENLRIVTNKYNLEKGTKITEEARGLLDKWGVNKI